MAVRRKNNGENVQLPLFKPTSEWRPPELSSLPSWADADRISIDCETRDPHLKELGISVRRGGYICGVAFAIDGGQRYYLPMRHQGGDNLPIDSVLHYLKTQAKSFKGELVGANLSYDLDYLWEEGIFFPQVKFYRDIQIADPLIYELHMSYSLQNIAQRYGFEGKDEALLRQAAADYGVDPKGGMWQLPARYVGAYAEGDVDQPLKILEKQELRISEDDLWSIWDLESQVLPALVRMRRRGVRIDLEKLHDIENWSLQQEGEALKTVKEQTGCHIEVGDVWKADALAPALEHIGIKLKQTSTGKPSIDKDLLGGIEHPVGKALAWARKTNKLRTTFAASIRKYMVGDRVHCDFNQIARETEGGDQKGARYGRLSSSNPNMQQQPSRDEFAKMWRSIYVPEEGMIWGSCDYSQQEPRWTTHFAAQMKLPKAQEAAQAYWDNPKLDNHQFMADLTGLERKFAKDVYLGVCYGEGGAKLSRDLGLPTRWALSSGRGRGRRLQFFELKSEAMNERAQLGDGYIWEAAGEEGQGILDKFDARAPFIRMLAKKAEQVAKTRGFVITFGGRKLHFSQRQDGSHEFTHKALNRIIQGSSADQTKMALVEIEKEMPDTFVQLQVHDELAGSFRNVEEAKQMAKIMAECAGETNVPFRVDVEIGPSWGEAEEIEE